MQRIVTIDRQRKRSLTIIDCFKGPWALAAAEITAAIIIATGLAEAAWRAYTGTIDAAVLFFRAAAQSTGLTAAIVSPTGLG